MILQEKFKDAEYDYVQLQNHKHCTSQSLILMKQTTMHDS
jgi:hypothetical protein